MIEFITTSLFVFSSIYGGPAATGTIIASSSAPVTPAPQVEEMATATIPTTNEGIEAEAKAYFKNEPILVAIAGCESAFRQYDANGHVLEGIVNKGDLGVMQINKYYHAEKAAELGDNLDTPIGNMAYAKYLYEQEGTQPWNSSRACWGQSTSSDQVAMK